MSMNTCYKLGFKLCSFTYYIFYLFWNLRFWVLMEIFLEIHRKKIAKEKNFTINQRLTSVLKKPVSIPNFLLFLYNI